MTDVMAKAVVMVGAVVVGFLIGLLLVLPLGWLTMFAWNHVIPQVFVGVPALTFWQGCWLYFLSTLIIKSGFSVSK